MMAFDALYFDIAKREARAFVVVDDADLPRDTYVLREFFCNDRGCDCRRVVLQIHSVERKRVVATINYAFEPSKPPWEDEGQMFLDPLNPQSELSDVLFEMFEEMIQNDREYHERLVRHYQMWKRVVDDPGHPDHGKVRVQEAHQPAVPGQAPVRRDSQRARPNDPCPCGSGKKFKRCCRP